MRRMVGRRSIRRLRTTELDAQLARCWIGKNDGRRHESGVCIDSGSVRLGLTFFCLLCGAFERSSTVTMRRYHMVMGTVIR